MGNKLYVTKVPTQTSKSCTDNTVNLSSEISRAAMKAAQEAAKQQSRTCKGNNIFQTIKSISCQTGAFFI
jgi:hypothetical protein